MRIPKNWLRGGTSWTKPGMSLEQQAVKEALSMLPAPARTAFAAEATMRPYTEPQDRRQFFRNTVGLPHRGRQIEGMKDYAEMEDAWNDMGNQGATSEAFDAIASFYDPRIARGESPLDAQKPQVPLAPEGDIDSLFLDFPEDPLESQTYKRFSNYLKGLGMPKEPEAPEDPSFITNLLESLRGRFGR